MIVVAKRMDPGGAVLRVPLGQSSQAQTHQFSTPITAQYRIGVECARKLPFETMKSLLQQGNLVEVELHRGAALEKLNYFAQAPRSQSGDSSAQLGNLNAGKDTIGQDIAYFSATRGDKYEVSSTLIRPLGELSTANPTLIVYRDPAPDIGRGVVSVAVLVTGYALLALGAALGVYYFLFSQGLRGRA